MAIVRAGLPKLMALAVGAFVAAFACDLLSWKVGGDGWVTVAFWLLGGSLALAALAGIIQLLVIQNTNRVRTIKAARWNAERNLVLVLIELCYLMARDAYGTDAIVPAGLALSALVIGIFFTGWRRWEGFHRRILDIADPALKPRLAPHP